MTSNIRLPQPAHLKAIFNELDPVLIDDAITKVSELMRDDLVNAARIAREQIRSTLYDVPRKRSKPEWGGIGHARQNAVNQWLHSRKRG